MIPNEKAELERLRRVLYERVFRGIEPTTSVVTYQKRPPFQFSWDQIWVTLAVSVQQTFRFGKS